jgi:hypothetical protein
MSLDETAECLALGKTTVWYWIRDLPDPAIKHRGTPARRRSRKAAFRSRTRTLWGVLTVTANDTQLRARLQGWIDRVHRSWLDSLYPGV